MPNLPTMLTLPNLCNYGKTKCCLDFFSVGRFCADPGNVAFGSRHPATGPYPVGSTITYTCEFPTIGGGTILCREIGSGLQIHQIVKIKMYRDETTQYFIFAIFN